MSKTPTVGTRVRSRIISGVSYIRKADLIRWLDEAERDLRATGHEREAEAVAETAAQLRRVP